MWLFEAWGIMKINIDCLWTWGIIAYGLMEEAFLFSSVLLHQKNFRAKATRRISWHHHYSPVKWWHKHNWFVNHVSIPRVGKFVSADFVPLKGTRSISNSNIRDSQMFEGGSLPTMTKSFAWDTLGRILTYHSEILETIEKITTPLKGVLTNSPWAFLRL